MIDQRDKLEQAYWKAYERVFKSPGNPTANAERALQEADDALSEYCDETLQCKHTNCRTITPQHAYCEEHREP